MHEVKRGMLNLFHWNTRCMFHFSHARAQVNSQKQQISWEIFVLNAGTELPISKLKATSPITISLARFLLTSRRLPQNYNLIWWCKNKLQRSAGYTKPIGIFTLTSVNQSVKLDWFHTNCFLVFFDFFLLHVLLILNNSSFKHSLNISHFV